MLSERNQKISSLRKFSRYLHLLFKATLRSKIKGYLGQDIFDAFSANRIFDFAETWVFVLRFSKNNQFPLKYYSKIEYFGHISTITMYFPLCLGQYFLVIFSKFCGNLEFFAWVMSFFLEASVFLSLSFLNCPKKPDLGM